MVCTQTRNSNSQSWRAKNNLPPFLRLHADSSSVGRAETSKGERGQVFQRREIIMSIAFSYSLQSGNERSLKQVYQSKMLCAKQLFHWHCSKTVKFLHGREREQAAKISIHDFHALSPDTLLTESEQSEWASRPSSLLLLLPSLMGKVDYPISCCDLFPAATAAKYVDGPKGSQWEETLPPYMCRKYC